MSSPSYYDILEITKTATDKDIKKAYKRLAMKYHPDKADENKKEEHTKKFQQITEANEVLSDPEKRKLYDTYGKAGLDESRQRQTQPHDDIHSIFNMFPGMFPSQRSRPQGPRKTPDTQFTINISLAQAYTGITKKFRITKDTIVNIALDDPVQYNFENSWETCMRCGGQGFVIEQNRMGNVVQMTQQNCIVCQGSGFRMKEGFEIKQMPENVSLDIQKGCRNGTQIRIPHKGNTGVGTLPGDIVVIIQISNTERGFTRVNDDLRYVHPISLCEALCGGKLKIVTLDERELYIKFGPINPGDVKQIKGEGMTNSNDLYISFDIQFPKLSKEEQTAIKAILPVNSNPNNEFDDNKIKFVL
jgi:DnaJ-class molecular chaperone